MHDNNENENIAATLARVLPQAMILGAPEAQIPNFFKVAVPTGFKVEQIDLEKLLPNPRRTNAIAKFSDADSLIRYIATHKRDGSTAWCKFDPQTFALDFSAVIDEHTPTLAGWRSHRANFTPDMSAEWKAWKLKDGIEFTQVAFAEWIEEHAEDITTPKDTTTNQPIAGMPSSLDMLKMATDFHANEERILKSTVKLNSGGVKLVYIADPETGNTEDMKFFDKFAIGIPVFQGGSPWGITARLKFRLRNGAVFFHYELVRADRVHEHAAVELIAKVRDSIDDVPLMMGAIA